jgi:hypothetical protein
VDGIKITIVGRVAHRNVNALLMALALYREVRVVLAPFTGGVTQRCRSIVEPPG